MQEEGRDFPLFVSREIGRYGHVRHSKDWRRQRARGKFLTSERRKLQAKITNAKHLITSRASQERRAAEKRKMLARMAELKGQRDDARKELSDIKKSDPVVRATFLQLEENSLLRTRVSINKLYKL